MTIVTQTEEVINYNAVAKISLISGTVTDENTGAETTVYVIIASDVLPDVSDDDFENVSIQLGVFDSEDECRLAFNQLLESIGKNEPIFYVPQSVEIESK